MMNRRALVALVVSLTFFFPVIHGWGKDGHLTTCRIAQSMLSKTAADAVRELLPDYADNDLGSLCSWADHVKFRYHWSSPLHYIDTPDSLCNYQYNTLMQVKRINGELQHSILKKHGVVPNGYIFCCGLNCSTQEDKQKCIQKFKPQQKIYTGDCKDANGEKDRCVAGAINNYTTQLLTYGSSSSQAEYNLTEALLFLSHYMGDIHQPLHVGFTSDRGANTIDVHWYRRKTVLHHVWDASIIETSEERFYNSNADDLIDAIQKNITDTWADQVQKWERCSYNKTACPDIYASESIKAACDWSYKGVTEDSTLEDDYFLSRVPVVYLRLAQGGVRLAATLNRIFGS